MPRLQLFLWMILSAMRFSLSDLDVCGNRTLTFDIGRKLTILDIKAEEISALTEPCRKSIKLPGLESATFIVEGAQFSANRYWTYGDYGMAIKLFYDDAHVHFGKCEPIMSDMTKIRTGLARDFNSPELCVVLEPETDFRRLGGHVEGMGVNISVLVNIAHCQHSDESRLGGNDQRCFDLCSADGVVKRCHGPPTEAPALNPTTSTRAKPSLPQDSHQTITATHKAEITTHVGPQLTQTDITVSTEAMTQVQSTPKGNHPNTDPVISTSPATNASTSTSTSSVKQPYSLTLNYQTITATTASSDSPDQTTQMHVATDHASQEEQFGVAEGVYIFGGCALIILVVATIGCCIGYRRKKCVCPKSSDTSPSVSNSHTCSTNKDLFWQDNWLVRYHNNPVFRQAESDVDYDQLDLEMLDNTRNMDQLDLRLKEEDPYDNPWPLVRLDSDFVRNTKQLDRTSSGETNRTSEQSTGKMSSTAHDSMPVTNAIKTLNETVTYQNNKRRHHSFSTALDTGGKSIDNNKTNFKKHEPRHRSRGSFSIVRIRQGSSNSDKDRRPRTYSANGKIGHVSRSNSGASDWYRDKIQSMKAKQSSERAIVRKNTSSSTSSDRSIYFEELIQQEIDKIEGTTELNAAVDLDKSGSVRYKTGNQDWKVRTLYAMVSPRKDVPHGCGASGTIQFSQ